MVYKDKSISKEDIFYYVYGFLYSPSIELNLVLERKPRSVWNARPVKDNVAQELLEWGKLLPGGNKEMVKLLRLCVDYGQDKILGIKKLIPSGVIPTVDLIRSYLVPPASPAVLHLKNELEIDSVDLSAYDRKFGMVAEQ